MIQIIAEIGQAHEGSLVMAQAYIDAVAKAGLRLLNSKRILQKLKVVLMRNLE